MAAASIPNITALRTELDYGDARLPRCATFNDDTRAFRRKFVTKRGVPGVDLHDWKSRDGQAGLTEMTVAYLDKEGSGRLFWPDDPSSPNYNKYQYSKDAHRIRRLVKQLFFRLNQQQFRNHKYKHKDPAETKALDERGHNEQTPIDVDAITVDLVTKSPKEPPLAANKSASPDLRNADRSLEEQSPSHGRVTVDNADVYDVPKSIPSSPSPRRQFYSINQPTRAKRSPHHTDTSSEAQQAKRQKRQPKSPFIDDSEPADGKKSPSGKWKSPRTKRQPQREGMVGYNEITEEVFSPERAPGPEQDDPQPAPTAEPATLTFRGSNNDPVESALSDIYTRYVRPVTIGFSSEPRRPSWPTPTPEVSAETAPTQGVSVALNSPSLPNPPNATSHDEADRPKAQITRPFNSYNSNSHSQSPTPCNSVTRLAAVEERGTRGANPSTATANKPSINFTYRVVLTRKPKTITERWTPRGRFQDKTLAELLKELPFGDDLLFSGEHSQGLIFTIESECMRTVERLAYDDEGGFASMKRYINMEIREWAARQLRAGLGRGGKLDIDVLIERMTNDKDGDEVKPGGEDELEDFEPEW